MLSHGEGDCKIPSENCFEGSLASELSHLRSAAVLVSIAIVNSAVLGSIVSSNSCLVAPLAHRLLH